MMHHLRLVVLLLLTMVATLTARAAPLPPDQVPDPLKPWVNWVLQDAPDRNCPRLYSADQHFCAWPSTLELNLNEQGGTFTQRWQVYNESIIRLPGDAQHWPFNVQTDQNAPLTVLPQNEYPTVKLAAGTYIIKGQFQWDKLPKTVFVSPESGLIQLTVNGTAIANPEFNNEGRLWLTQNNEASSEDNLDIQVFRKITDSHPIQVLTQIQLRVSGKQRNADLSPVLLDGFIPLALETNLPSRIERNQHLQVQLRPGEWTINVVSRAPNNLTTFTLPQSKEPWPSQEIWVFEADHTLRQVEVTGVPSIDPNQTKLPSDWNTLPAYLMNSGDTLTLNEQHRGITINKTNELSLKRTLWLDFAGSGYSIQDQLRGTLAEQGRINVTPELKLGRVAINGAPQLITQQTGTEPPNIGVEVRQNSLSLSADSRYENSITTPPVNGWQQELQSINTQLFLPPGWRLLHASGMDNVPNTWVADWSLLDLFLVLIIALAVGYLYKPLWGVFALGALVLIWHEDDAPRVIWLNLLAVIALIRLVPEGTFKKLLHYYRLASFVVLALVVVPYMIDTIRTALYPQLERSYEYYGNTGFSGQVATTEMAAPAAPEAEMDVDTTMQQQVQNSSSNMVNRIEKSIVNEEARKDYKAAKKSKVDLNALDPNSMIQTGPGLPNWQWSSVNFSWAGPIKPDDTMYLMLMNPTTTALWKFLGIALILVLAWRLVWPRTTPTTPSTPQQWWQAFKQNPVQTLKSQFVLSLFALATVSVLSTTPNQAVAEELPSEELLQTLRERLLAAPDCLPQCAQIESMHAQIQGDNLQLRLRVHAAQQTAIPLPTATNTWLPQQVLIDGNPSAALKRDSEQQLWAIVDAGQHEVLLQGVLPKRSNFTLSLPLKPYRVTFEGTNWTLEGLRDNGVPESQLQLLRTSGTEQAANLDQEATSLPTFVRVERRLNLGLDWYIETTVTRLSDSANPLTLSIPLLSGEQPMSEQLTVKDGQIKTNFKAQQKEVSWSSRLNPIEKLTLKAATNADYLEEWEVAASPVWNVQAQGIPISEFVDDEGISIPVWKPWPNETLELTITRPEGVTGQTVTILSSKVIINPSKRAKDVELNVRISSSRGTQHTMTLPADIEVKNLTINGTKRTLQQQGDKLIIPLNPGEQDITITWQDPNPISTFYRFPTIDVGTTSVNSNATLNMPADRWVLWVNGPDLGPAVLFWGVLLALLIVSVILGKANITPLKTWQWFLLAVGLSQSSSYLLILMVIWLVALTQRAKLKADLPTWTFNGMQVVLIGLTGLVFISLVGAVAQGLLGHPDMQITGYGSSSSQLNWYQDRTDKLLPQPVVVSVPMWAYRLLMLAWALWLAITVLGWLRWGWQAFSTGGLWKSSPKKLAKSAAPNPVPVQPTETVTPVVPESESETVVEESASKPTPQP